MATNKEDVIQEEQEGEILEPITKAISVVVSAEKRQQLMEATKLHENATLIAADIKNNVDFEKAAEFAKTAKAMHKSLEAYRKSLTKPIDALKKFIMDVFREPLAKLEHIETVIKEGMKKYLDEQERKRIALQAEQEEKTRKEAEKLRKKAATAEKNNKPELANAFNELADDIPTPVVVANAPKVAGVSAPKRYYAEVVDVIKLLKAIIAGKVPLSVIKVDMTILNKQATTFGTELNYPGVVVKTKTTIAMRTE